MDMTLPQTPNFVPMHPSLRESPIKLHREIEELKAKIEEKEDELKMLKNDYKLLKVDRDNPKFADALLTWINRTDDEITKSTDLLSAANTRLKSVECESELRNIGMLYLSSISSLIVFI
jgi:phage shock protein A